MLKLTNLQTSKQGEPAEITGEKPGGTVVGVVEVVGVTYVSPKNFAIMRVEVVQLDEGPEWLRRARRAPLLAHLDARPKVGDIYAIVGESVLDERHGLQVKASACTRAVASDERAVRSFLCGFSNIGQHRAREIIETFGGLEAVIEVLEQRPHELTKINGITRERAAQIGEEFNASRHRTEAFLYLAKLPLSPSQISKVYETLGSRTVERVQANPFYLLRVPGLTFGQVSTVADALGVARDDPRRLQAGIALIVEAAQDAGHTYSTPANLLQDRDIKRTCENVGLDNSEKLRHALVMSCNEDAPTPLEQDGQRFALRELAFAERELAQGLRRFL